MPSLKYADAGVDIPAGNETKKQIGKLVAATYNTHVVGGFGHFGGLFDVTFLKEYQEPVLVSSVDGVGTKLKIAFDTGNHGSVGRDIVNHCVNDILVLGAKPLFFLDYIAAGKMVPEVILKVIEGMAAACKEADMVLIGGETAQMPDFYKPSEYDLAGTVVGIVDKKDIIDGSGIREGDVVIGLRSDGLHTNGYSLARKIVTEAAGKRFSDVFAPTGKTFGEELLRSHLSYAPLRGLMQKKLVKGCAHITGGGFPDNVNRILPADCDAVIETKRWTPEPIFGFLKDQGNVEPFEMYRTFNMGIGMAVVVSPRDSDRVIRAGEIARFAPKVIGMIVKGSGKVAMEF
jgi:phosphoribosylformylglycinamidine cyclo-ligase